ncbi:epididymal-specific lipocalin-6 isoform 1-T1 [Glossophaga mutica]
MDVVELLRQNPAWVFRNPCKWARRVGRAPRPWAQRPAATPGPRGQGHLCSQASGHSLPGSETASFCQRLGANSEDRGLARAPATLGWDPRPPLCCVGRWDLAPVGTGSREPGPLCCGYSPDAPSTVTTSSVCGVGGVGGGTGPWPPQACWPRPTGLRSPARGVLEYRVLGTDFRDFAIVFTQLEQRDEAFSTVELYSRTQQASPEAVSRFTRWSQGLGFLSQQQAQLQADGECGRAPLLSLGDPRGRTRGGRGGFKESLRRVRPAGTGRLDETGWGLGRRPALLTAPPAPSSHLRTPGLPGKLPPEHRRAPRAPLTAGRAWGPGSPRTPVGCRAQWPEGQRAEQTPLQ